MRKALFATLIGACFVMGGGVAGASFIRYVAAPGPVMAERTADERQFVDTASLAYAPPKKAATGACSAEVQVCDAAFAAFMLQAVLGANGSGGEALAALRDDAAKKLKESER